MVSPLHSLDQVVNLKVKITNLLDDSVTGSIYAFSPKQKILALKLHTGSPPKKGSEEVFKIINTAFIKSISVVGPPAKKSFPRENGASPRLEKLDLASIEKELNKSIEFSKKGKKEPSPGAKTHSTPHKKQDPSPLAQRVYNKMASAFGKENVQFLNNESLLLFKEVTVSKPYALNKISTLKKKQISKHVEPVKAALREYWLEASSSKRGG